MPNLTEHHAMIGLATYVTFSMVANVLLPVVAPAWL
jgi:hypothetical protein